MLPAIARFMVKQTFFVSLAVFIMGSVTGVFAAPASETVAQSNICKSAIRQVERANRMPNMLLHAVSLAESGRWNSEIRASFAWPWTVTAKGKGNFYPDRDTAITAVKQLQQEGIKNIDVGCMQINLKHHKSAFRSLEEAFSPAANARYAAKFLRKLRTHVGSWAHDRLWPLLYA